MHVSLKTIKHAALYPLELDAVQVDAGFWAERQRTNATRSLAHGYRMLEKTGTLDNLRLAAGQTVAGNPNGEFHGFVFQDSDLYKWLEAAALVLRENADEELEARVEGVIAILAAAQMPDGYLNSYFTIMKPGERWTDLEWAHEMYCAGHLIEAAIAYQRAKGRTNLMEIARRFADHIDATFGPGKRAGLCGHPEIELALVELARETNEPRYLQLAEYFVDQRGHQTFAGLRQVGPRYMQDSVPVREAQVVEGHAVRQLYLNAGVTDVYLETGEAALREALERQWRDMTHTKMYLTGGVGARSYGEMFGEPYELPTKEAYCETCAAIAAMMWNWRMLLATGEARYADLMERVLYNGFLSGYAADGTHFFYENPLRTEGSYPRQEWYACACCPPNVMRQIALVGNYAATTNERGVQLHQYMPAHIVTPQATLRVETNYPWEETVRVVVEEGEGEFALDLRVPGWCEMATLTVNDTPMEKVNGGGYTTVERDWKVGDMVELTLPMRPHFVASHPYVEATRGAMAIERGPLVYCIEQADQSADVDDLRVNEEGELRADWRADIGGGVMTVQAEGKVLEMGAWADELYREDGDAASIGQAATLTAIPYYAWGNRGEGKMRVWIPVAE